MKRILDRSFLYVPAVATDVAMTWRRYGFSAQVNAERRARVQPRADAQDNETEAREQRDLFLRVAAARQAA